MYIYLHINKYSYIFIYLCFTCISVNSREFLRLIDFSGFFKSDVLVLIFCNDFKKEMWRICPTEV